jgi:hypothetical protein
VRISIVADAGRVDLTVPGDLPVAELLPDVAHRLGVLDAAAGGLRLCTATGRRLTDHLGLAAQGVPDGAVLALAPRPITGRSRVHDDPAWVVAEAVTTNVASVSDGVRLAVRLASAATLLTVGGVGLALAPRSVATLVVAGSAVVGLLSVAGWVSGERGSGVVALLLAHGAAGYAGVLGYGVAVRVDSGASLAWCGAAVAATTAIGFAALRVGWSERAGLMPAAGVGVAVLGAGLADAAAGVAPAVTLSGIAAVAVLTGGGLASASAAWLGEDPVQVGARACVAQGGLLWATAATGALVVVGAPAAAGLGHAGAGLALAMCVAFASSSRREHSGRAALVRVGCGVAGVALAAPTYLIAHPGSAPALAAALAASGVVGLAAPAGATSLRSQQWADGLEAFAVLSLLPLLVAASGVAAAVRG